MLPVHNGENNTILLYRVWHSESATDSAKPDRENTDIRCTTGRGERLGLVRRGPYSGYSLGSASAQAAIHDKVKVKERQHAVYVLPVELEVQ